jgi:hypothetical protein
MRGTYTLTSPATAPAKCAAKVPLLGIITVPNASSNQNA